MRRVGTALALVVIVAASGCLPDPVLPAPEVSIAPSEPGPDDELELRYGFSDPLPFIDPNARWELDGEPVPDLDGLPWVDEDRTEEGQTWTGIGWLEMETDEGRMIGAEARDSVVIGPPGQDDDDSGADDDDSVIDDDDSGIDDDDSVIDDDDSVIDDDDSVADDDDSGQSPDDDDSVADDDDSVADDDDSVIDDDDSTIQPDDDDSVIDDDDATPPPDGDGDGWDVTVDCDDTDPSIHPHAIEVPLDTVDDNCDGLDYCEDLNCDGWTDIVFANYGPTSNPSVNSWIYWGGPSGFSDLNRGNLPTDGAWDVKLADLNANGYIDIVLSNFNGGEVYIYWGGAGGYTTLNRTDLPCGGAAGLSVANLDYPDSFLDIVCSRYSDGADFELLSPLFWNSSGTFTGSADYFPTSGSHRSFTGEITGDTHVDLVFSCNHDNTINYTVDSHMYLGSSGGPYATNVHDFQTTGSTDIDAGLIDSDGWYDLVVVTLYDPAQVYPFETWSYTYWDDGTNWWSASNRTAFPTTGACQVSLLEIDGDGAVDMIVSQHEDGSTVSVDSYVWWGTGGAWSTALRTPLATVGAWGHAAGDLDDDGDIDIIFCNSFDDSGNVGIDSYLYHHVGSCPTGDCWPVSARETLPTNNAKNVAISGPGAEVPRSY